jgi:hypothetical protein
MITHIHEIQPIAFFDRYLLSTITPTVIPNRQHILVILIRIILDPTLDPILPIDHSSAPTLFRIH